MKNTHCLIFLGLLVFFVPGNLRADNLKNNFKSHLNQNDIDELTKDVGALVGGGTFHTGKALKFPLGFDVGAHAIAVDTNDNPILSDDGSSAISGSIQGELGLPLKLNLIARAGRFEDADFLGGGIRWGIIKGDLPGLPSLSLTGLYNKVSHDYFNADVLSANLSLSFNVPIIHPYIGIGYDSTSLDVENAAYIGAPGSAVANLDSQQDTIRGEVGINLSIIPFTYITIAGGLAHEDPIYHAALGIQF